jgi:type I restriction enzyme S subunit
MARYKLEALFDLQMGKTPARINRDYWNDGSNPWISISDMSTYSKYVDKTKETISDLGISESGIKQVPQNTVIMSFKLSLGKVAITVKPIYTNEAIMAFIDKGVTEICSDYIYYLFLFMDWSNGTNKAVLGATLNKASLSNYEINLPSIYEQHNVVAILDKATFLITQRKQQLTQLDLLVKSRFIGNSQSRRAVAS